MNRAPIAAWQGLFAAGGAPAASHAALARVPVREKLLAPLAGSTLVREGRFDALVRPVELGGVLGTRIAGANAPKDVSDGERDTEVGASSRVPGGLAAEGGQRRSAGHSPDERGSEAGDTAKRRRPIVPRAPRASRLADESHIADHRASRAVATSHPTSAEPHSTHRVDDASRAGAVHRRAPVALPLSDMSESASRTPVVVGPASHSVTRLLHASEARSQSARERPGAVSGDSASVSGGSTSSALERVLARIAQQGPAHGSESGSARPNRGRGSTRGTETSPVLSARQMPTAVDRAMPTNHLQRELSEASAEHGSGGFRGLATRAMRQSEGALPAVSSAAPHLTHEVRTISDLPLDALDANVAESVTRILQREARRHGIDLVGVGP